MFPFHQKGDLSFQVPNNNDEHEDIVVINNHANYLANYGKSLPNDGQDYNTINNNVNHQGNKVISGNDVANKRIIHRETERQRRQEMTTLFSSLRSILPLEYIKGKRSMSDHISEAAKYIKDLERNVKELGNKRDNIKEITCYSSSTTKLHEHVTCSSTSTTTSSSSRDGVSIKIYAFSKAIEIEIEIENREQVVEDQDHHFPLSKLLKVLNEEGLDVMSCVSSKLSTKWIYVIHCKVEDAAASIDSSQLEWRLKSEINQLT